MIVFSDGLLADFEKIFDFTAGRDPATALDHIDKMASAASAPETQPKSG